METLKVLMWAAVHSPDFRYCRISSPFWVKVVNICGDRGLSIWLGFPSVYIPYMVIRAYQNAMGITDEFDDVPF